MAKVNGFELICPVCSGKKFNRRSSLLNTRGLTFISLDWANQSAINYICDCCGYIFWFLDDGREYVEKYYEEKEAKEQDISIDYETSEAEIDECPVCFCKHDLNQDKCLNCGHSFK